MDKKFGQWCVSLYRPHTNSWVHAVPIPDWIDEQLTLLCRDETPFGEYTQELCFQAVHEWVSENFHGWEPDKLYANYD